jgi:2-iminobutanoate/2-iminopropanoate deaminase
LIRQANIVHGLKRFGPYSHAFTVGGLTYLSAQSPVDPETGEVTSDDVTAQFYLCADNCRKILNEVGLELAHVIKVVIYVANFDHVSAINEAYEKLFLPPLPVRSVVGVALSPQRALVELELIAAAPNTGT